jgi:hypothetical protein
MTTAKKVATALVVLALGGATWWEFARNDAARHATTTAAAPAADTSSSANRRRREDVAPTPEVAAKPGDDAPTVAGETKPVVPTDEQRKQWPIRVITNVVGARVTMRVRVCGGGGDPPPETKTTDEKGFVGFAAPAADVVVGELDFVARAEGWATATVSTRPEDVRLELRRATAVRGRVTDAAGRPLADVHVWRVEPPQEATMTLTDSSGAFESFFTAPGAGSLRVSHPAFLEKTVAVAAPATDVVIALEHGREVSGRVAFPDGRPIPGVLLYGENERVATTDADGRYTVSGLTEGRVDIRLGLGNGSEQRFVDSGTTGVDFVIDRPVARVRFVDADGRPYRFVVPRMRLCKDDKDLWTWFASGAGESEDRLVPGAVGATLLVSATAGERVKGVATLAFGDEVGLRDVVVRMGAERAKGALRVVVRTGAGEIPRTACVVVTDEIGEFVAGSTTKPVVLDDSGAFEFKDVPAGRDAVVVSAAPFRSPEAVRTFLVTAHVAVDVESAKTAQAQATLALGGRIRVVVKNADGIAVRPQFVSVPSPSGGRFLAMFGRTTRDGGWASELDASPAVLADALAPGAYRVHAEMKSRDVSVDDVDVTVAAGLTVDVELVTKPKR